MIRYLWSRYLVGALQARQATFQINITWRAALGRFEYKSTRPVMHKTSLLFLTIIHDLICGEQTRNPNPQFVTARNMCQTKKKKKPKTFRINSTAITSNASLTLEKVSKAYLLGGLLLKLFFGVLNPCFFTSLNFKQLSFEELGTRI